MLRKQIECYQTAGQAIVYIDESGFSQDMPRTHGYSTKGKRCFGICDWNARGRTNVIGAMIGSLLLTVCLFTTNIDADVFHSWTVSDLIPKLTEKSVIVMDNATFHKRTDIITAITNAGHTLLFLPTYSPDLNPIENKWAQAKAIRRRTQCSVDELFEKFEI